MKNYSLTILALILAYTSQAQSLWDDATISAHFSVAHHDKRLFGYSETSKQKLLDRSPETWGTWQYGLEITKKILGWGRIFETHMGLGYSAENLTFYRPIDHCFYKPGGFCTAIVVRSESYWVQQLAIPFNVLILPVKNWQLSIDLRPSFAIHKGFSGSNIGKWMFDFYSMEINPGLRYNYGQLVFGVNYRLWQWKKIDRALYSQRTIPGGETSYPILSETYEDYNPLKLWFSVGYQLGNPDHSRK